MRNNYRSYQEMEEDIGEQSGEFVWQYLVKKFHEGNFHKQMSCFCCYELADLDDLLQEEGVGDE